MEDADTLIDRRAGRAAAGWHAVWLAAFGLSALAWMVLGASGSALALALAAAPGLIGQLLRVSVSRGTKSLVALAWPLCVGAAIALTGGLGGPMTALAIAPIAAMITLDRRRYLPFGAAFSAAIIALIALTPLLGLTLPAPPTGPLLALLVVAFAAIAFAGALQMAGGREHEREAARADEAARLRNLLEAEPFLLLRLDREGIIREVFCGAPEDWDLKLIGRPFENLAGEAHRGAARAALRILRKEGAASVGFAPPLAPDRFLAVELRGLHQGGAAALVRDASRERAYEAWLEQGKADAESLALSKSRFLANMSHELRTPLNAIIGFSDIMRSRLFGPMPERYAEYAGLIHESGGHLLDLINDVLDMSKIEADRYALSLEEFDAREAVSAALRLTRLQADTAKIALRGVLPPTALDVNADRRALKQIVLNLVSNSLKFTPTGGQVNVLVRQKGTLLELIVADTGVGIAPADLERLGRPYEQAGGMEQRQLGTGLGLSLVRAFAELHGGRMVIKSILGEGTVVTVELPVMEERPAAAPPPPPPEPPQRVALGDNVIAFVPHR
jgi:cell cycle sensor histidine kinase DivJ